MKQWKINRKKQTDVGKHGRLLNDGKELQLTNIKLKMFS